MTSPTTQRWLEIKKYDLRLNFSLPDYFSGDEPAYIVLLYSLTRDFDLDLKNNYHSVHQGSWQAGRNLASAALDHHTFFSLNDKPIPWWDIFYGWDSPHWEKDSAGKPIPTRKQYVSSDVSRLPEYSIHTMGVSFILAPLVFLFRNTDHIGTVAIFGSALAVFLGIILFRVLLNRFTEDVFWVNLVTFVAFFTTPVWRYGRMLFPEPFLLVCVVGAFAFAITRKSGLYAGLCLGLAMQFKPPYLLLIFPLGLLFFLKRSHREAALLMIGPSISFLILAALNYRMIVSPFQFPHPLMTGNFFEGLTGLLFDVQHGLLPFAPSLVCLFLMWPWFIKRAITDGLALMFGFLLITLFMALWYDWRGGWCYGPRMIIPVIPLLFIPLVLLKVWNVKIKLGIFLKSACIATVWLGFILNALGAIYHRPTWNTHPLMPIKYYMLNKS